MRDELTSSASGSRSRRRSCSSSTARRSTASPATAAGTRSAGRRRPRARARTPCGSSRSSLDGHPRQRRPAGSFDVARDTTPPAALGGEGERPRLLAREGRRERLLPGSGSSCAGAASSRVSRSSGRRAPPRSRRATGRVTVVARDAAGNVTRHELGLVVGHAREPRSARRLGEELVRRRSRPAATAGRDGEDARCRRA